LRFYGANATSSLFRDGLNFGTNRDRSGSQQLRPRGPDLFYAEIRTVMTLPGKRDDITATITNYEKRLAQSRTDLPWSKQAVLHKREGPEGHAQTFRPQPIREEALILPPMLTSLNYT
jgi:hypothetical protein